MGKNKKVGRRKKKICLRWNCFKAKTGAMKSKIAVQHNCECKRKKTIMS